MKCNEEPIIINVYFNAAKKLGAFWNSIQLFCTAFLTWCIFGKTL